MKQRLAAGFTLIELSIVLVIIGLIVGGVLVGVDLVRAAGVRAQITQIEKFDSAANTFFGKYGFLPGDIPAVPAAQFGFVARGSLPGQGDGNGLLQGSNIGAGTANGVDESAGETVMFWVDLRAAHLIEGGFSTASPNTDPGSNISGVALNNWLPAAKIGQGNYVYAFSSNSTYLGYKNYYGLSVGGQIVIDSGFISTPGLSVVQAYQMDQKADDGLPGTGNIVALYTGSTGAYWAGIGSGTWPGTAATQASATTCFDNGNASGATQHYSIEYSGGTNVTCALSFRIRAGD